MPRSKTTQTPKEETSDNAQERKELFDKINKDLDARTGWEDRQRLWYEMRHDGIARAALPWAGAADLHDPLADQKIEEQKPKYYSQIFSQQHVAFFVVPTDSGLDVAAKEDEKKFDYKLKNKSNLQWEALVIIDKHLERGHCFTKVIYDKDDKRICIDGIEPLMIILPPYAKIADGKIMTDRLVHVIQMPVWMYKENKSFNQDEEFIKLIKGGKDWMKNDSSQQQKIKEYREGFTGSDNEEEIIVWEVWTKNGDKWNVEYMSPQNIDEPIKKKMASPNQDGSHPFIYLPREIKDKGVYDARGVPEMVAVEEAVCNKILNETMDRFTISMRPFFVPTTPMPNTQNFDFAPLGCAPYPISALTIPPPPTDPLILLQNFTASAERRIGVFNMAMGGGNNAAQGNEFPTKFQMQLVAGSQSDSIDLRARVFRMFLTELYKKCWMLYGQYEPKEFKLAGAEFDIVPSGSPDGLTKEVLLQRSTYRMQKYAGNPYIDQKRLVEDDLENDDPRLVQKLMIEPQDTANDQAEEQAKEILLLEQGRPTMAKPNDDHKTHIKEMLQREQMLAQMRVPSNPIGHSRKAEHAITHLGYMKQQADPEFKIYKDMVEQVFMPKQNGANGAQPMNGATQGMTA